MSKFEDLDFIFSGALNPTEMMQMAEDLDLSEWAGHNLKLQETEAQRQKYTRDLTVQGEQILRDLGNERKFEQAGVSRKKMPGRGQRMQNVLGTLRSDDGEVIAPFVHKTQTKAGDPIEKRWYTRETESPLIKGYQEVEPFANPETGKPLMTTFADANKVNVEGITVDPRWSNVSRPDLGRFYKPQQGDHATELVTKHAAWLAGRTDLRDGNNVKPEDFLGARNKNDYFDALKRQQGPDFMIGNRPVDAEVIKASKVERTNGSASAQLFRKVDDPRPGRQVQEDLLRQMRRDGSNLIDAVDDKYNSNGRRGALDGKVMEDYTVLQLEYPDKYADKNLAHEEIEVRDMGHMGEKEVNALEYKNDKITEPPNRVTAIDPQGIKAEIQELGPNIPKDRVSVYQGKYSGQGSKLIKYQVPGDSPAIKDISGKGQVPQILKNLDYVQSPETPTPLTSIARTVKNVAKNPAVRMAGVALGAVPVLGDAADASVGTYEAVTETGDKQVRGAGNAVAGMTGLAAVAAPAAAPVLAPISGGLAVGNMAADWTKERRSKDNKYTSNAGLTSAHIHTPEAPVTIQAPSAAPVVSETQRRRNARRSTGGPVAKPSTAGGWWNKALGSLGLQ